MASARLAITHANDATPALGGIFSELGFFLLQRLPSRSTYVNKIQSNGGRVVKLEAQADYVIADHYRRDCPAGSISYTFIDAAIADGELPDVSEHTAGPVAGTIRPVGSGLPTKSTRTPFTAEDDLVLWRWVEPLRRKGGSWKGNEIYKQLEKENPRHTFQAWRDRYIKKLAFNPPTGTGVTVAANAPPSPPTAQDEQTEIEGNTTATGRQSVRSPVEQGDIRAERRAGDDMREVEGEDEEIAALPEDDIECLLLFAEDIERLHPDQEEDAWAAWSNERKGNTAEEWRFMWLSEARPLYLKSKKAKAGTLEDDDELMNEADETDISSTNAQKRKRKSTTDTTPQKRPNSTDTDRDPGQHEAEPHTAAAKNQSPQNATITTSDLNREAQAQFDEEVFGVAPVNFGADQQESSEPPPSDIEQAAQRQLLRETRDISEKAAEEVNVIQGSSPVRRTDDGTARLDLTPRGPVQALTRVNLAAMQEGSKARRGVDLPPDDSDKEEEIQDEFAAYLQDLMRRSGHPGVPADAEREQTPQPPGADLPTNSFATRMADTEAAFEHELPLSSEQEIDGAMDAMINWPESPKHKPPVLPSPSRPRVSQTEAAISYPDLPSQEANSPLYPRLRKKFDFSDGQIRPMTVDEAEDDVASSPPPTRHTAPGNESNRAVFDDSEESQASQNTQVAVPIDLSVAIPEGGWPSSSSPSKAVDARTGHHPGSDHVSISSSVSSSDDESVASVQSVIHWRAQAVETQDILNAETQVPDFHVPLPPGSPLGSDNDDLPSDPLERRQSSPAPTQQSQNNLSNTQSMNDEDVHAFIIKMVHLHGYNEDSVMSALERTSLRSEFAELVLVEDKLGRGLPSDVPGIWSEEDDVALEGGDATALKKLESKHTWDECEHRMKFLEQMRSDEDEDE